MSLMQSLIFLVFLLKSDVAAVTSYSGVNAVTIFSVICFLPSLFIFNYVGMLSHVLFVKVGYVAYFDTVAD